MDGDAQIEASQRRVVETAKGPKLAFCSWIAEGLACKVRQDSHVATMDMSKAAWRWRAVSALMVRIRQ
jgi:hypothetical protein